MDAADFGRELIEKEYVRKANGTPYKNARAAEKRYFDVLSETTNATPDQARAKLQGRVQSMEDATRLVMAPPRSPQVDPNSPSLPWLTRVLYSPAVSRSNSRGMARSSASKSNSPSGKEGSASSWGYAQASPSVSESNDLFDEQLASSTSIARAADDDADDDAGVETEQPSDNEGVETEQESEDDAEGQSPPSDLSRPNPSPSPRPSIGSPARFMLVSPGGATSRGGISSDMTLDPVTVKALSTIEPTVAAYAERMGLDLGSAEGRAELQRAKLLAGVAWATATAPQTATVMCMHPSDKNSFGARAS